MHIAQPGDHTVLMLSCWPHCDRLHTHSGQGFESASTPVWLPPNLCPYCCVPSRQTSPPLTKKKHKDLVLNPLLWVMLTPGNRDDPTEGPILRSS